MFTRGAIDESTYQEERHNLDQQTALAELEHLEAHEDEIDVQEHSTSQSSASRTGTSWVESDLSGKQLGWNKLCSRRDVTFDNHQIPSNPCHARHFLRDRACSGTKRKSLAAPGIRDPDNRSRAGVLALNEGQLVSPVLATQFFHFMVESEAWSTRNREGDRGSI